MDKKPALTGMDHKRFGETEVGSAEEQPAKG